MEKDINILWSECLTILSDNLTQSAFQTWFAPLVPLQYKEGVLVLQVKSQFVVDYIEENYIGLLSKVLFRVFGAGTQLEYRVLIDSTSGAGSTILSTGNTTEISRNERASELHPATAISATDTFDTQLNPQYTFESYIAGEPNKLARVAGVTVAQKPGSTAFNPLFIFGGSGVGKTHLANAIGNRVKLLYPEKKVLYVSANTFKLQYMTASQTNNIPSFLSFYQSVDVLIVDDIQYFAGLKGTQDTFFHIFNYLQQMQKQLILTSDRSPLMLKDIDDRLLTRFKWGLTAEVTHPDFALRKAILQHKIHTDGISLSEDVIDFIATNVRDNVRDLEGVLASLLAYSTLTNRDIDMELTEQVVSRLVEIRPKAVAVEEVLEAVCMHFNVTMASLMGTSRAREISQARHMAIYLCKEYTSHSLAEIGSRLGNRSHSTILHSINMMRNLIDIDPVARHQVKQIQAILAK